MEYSCLTMLCVSTVWQSESAIHVHMSPLFSISFPFMGFPCGSDCNEAACNAGDQSLIPGLGRSPWEWNGNHSSILAWRIPWIEEPGGLHTVHGVTKSQTRLSDSHSLLGHHKHWVVFPVLWSRISWVIYFIHSINSVQLSIPISQFIPCPVFPLVSICLFSMSVSLFLPCKLL